MSKQYGFSLIEIIIVIALVGILMTLAVLSLPDNSDQSAREAVLRVYHLLQLGSEEALSRGESLGLGFWSQGYWFFRLDAAQQWHIINDDRLFRERKLQDEERWLLYLDGLEVVLTEDIDEVEPKPQIFLLPSGEVSAFTLELEKDEDVMYRLSGNVLGELLHEQVDDE